MEFTFNPNPATIFVLKMLSAFYICCTYSNALQTTFDHGRKHYESSDQIVIRLSCKPVSHRTRLGTRFQYGVLGYTRVDWYEYWVPTMPGDVLVRLRLECSTSMYEQSTDILDQARWPGLSRFEHDCKTILIRLLYGFKYGLLRPSTIKHDFYSINWTFTGFTYGPTYFCSSFDGLVSQIFELSPEKV